MSIAIGPFKPTIEPKYVHVTGKNGKCNGDIREASLTRLLHYVTKAKITFFTTTPYRTAAVLQPRRAG